MVISDDLTEVADQLEELGSTLDISRRMSPRAQIRLLQETSDYLFKLAAYLRRKDEQRG